METYQICYTSATSPSVSEELNSVETLIFKISHYTAITFQKNLIVWKPKSTSTEMNGGLGVSEELNSVETNGCIYRIKKLPRVSEELNSVETHIYHIFAPSVEYVSEELNSVETNNGVVVVIQYDGFQKNLIVWKQCSTITYIYTFASFRRT